MRTRQTSRTLVRVWLADPQRQDVRDLRAAWAMLDEDERARAVGHAREADRQTYAVAHALLRCALARQTGRAPADFHFTRAAQGRPELLARPEEQPADRGDAPPPRFNLSHTRGLVGCAVTAIADVGFDVEEARQPAPLDVASRYFSAHELAALRALPAAAQPDRFYALWTLKESYIKGRGLGLRLPLASFSVTPGLRGRARLDIAAPAPPPVAPVNLIRTSRGATGAPWTLRWWRRGQHWIALAVAAPPDAVRVSLATDLRIARLGD